MSCRYNISYDNVFSYNSKQRTYSLVGKIKVRVICRETPLDHHHTLFESFSLQFHKGLKSQNNSHHEEDYSFVVLYNNFLLFFFLIQSAAVGLFLLFLLFQQGVQS